MALRLVLQNHTYFVWKNTSIVADSFIKSINSQHPVINFFITTSISIHLRRLRSSYRFVRFCRFCVLRNVPTVIFLSRHRSVIWSPLSSSCPMCSYHFPRDMYRALAWVAVSGRYSSEKRTWKMSGYRDNAFSRIRHWIRVPPPVFRPSPHARRWPKTPARRYCPRRDTINTARSWQ